MNNRPYETICEPIVAWCEKNYYTDFIVTIWINDHEQTEFLEFDATGPGLLVWKSDWWEGEKDVRLLGFAPLSEISIHNYQYPKEESNEQQE